MPFYDISETAVKTILRDENAGFASRLRLAWTRNGGRSIYIGTRRAIVGADLKQIVESPLGADELRRDAFPPQREKWQRRFSN